MIKVGIKSSAYFHLDDYEAGLKTLSEHGYNAVDYQEFSSMNSPLYAMSDENFEKYLGSVAACASASGVEIYQLHAIWPTAGDATEEGRQKSLWYYRRSMLGAKHLGCKRVVVHPWMPYGWQGGGTKEEYFKLNVRLLQELIPAAKEYGVYVCLENMPYLKGQAFSTVEEWKAVLDEVNDGFAKACLDTGHLNVMGEDPYASVLLLGKHLEAMHVHDNRWRQDMHLIPYQGTLDWDGLLKGLKDVGFDGCFSLETAISDATPVAVREKLQRALAELAQEMVRRITE